jgi:phosphatidylglycerol:prolipoprotein diacylglycerol transferase
MHPVLLQITLPGILPRIALLSGLAIALTVLGLAALIGARQASAVGVLIAGSATVLLFAHRTIRPAPIDLAITSFGFFLSISIILGCWLVIRTATRNGVALAETSKWLGLAMLGGFLGARWGYILANWSPGVLWRDMFSYEFGGLFGYGAYIGGFLVAGFAARRHFQSFRIWLDCATPAALFCIGLARLGCYFQGCDFGRPLGPKAPVIIRFLGTFPRLDAGADGAFSGSPAWLHHVSTFGLSTSATTSLPTHPTQLYEALFAWSAALLAYLIRRSAQFSGGNFLLMAAIFGLGRFFLEFLRGDPERGLLPVAHGSRLGSMGSWSQLIALVSVFASVVAWRHWSRGERTWTGFARLLRAGQK